MLKRPNVRKLGKLIPMLMVLVLSVMIFSTQLTLAHGPDDDHEQSEQKVQPQSGPAARGACDSANPVKDGLTLDQCVSRTFDVGGNTRTVSVFYTLSTATVTRTVDGTVRTLTHGIGSHDQANDVADATQEAWEAFYEDSTNSGYSMEPYLAGCTNAGNLDVHLEDGVGWAGIAWWRACAIGIDAPNVSNGVGTGDENTIAHEVLHTFQFEPDSCYNEFMPLYSDQDAEIEAHANAGMQSVDATQDAGYSIGSYGFTTSYHDKSYTNPMWHYIQQRLGTLGAPADSHYHIDPLYQRYRLCEINNDWYVIDELAQFMAGISKKRLMTDGFAAMYAFEYVSDPSQSHLDFTDDNDEPSGNVPWSQDVDMASGSNSWTESSPDDWATKYYRVEPDPGCDYLEMEVLTVPAGGEVGINFMATETGTPTLIRSSHIGDEFVRTFAAAGVYDELVVAVTSFDTVETYTVNVSCVIPQINILEPTQGAPKQVGAPATPRAFAGMFEVTASGGQPVRGLEDANFTFDAGGDPISVIGLSELFAGTYMASLMPPVKTPGTNFVDFYVCLDGGLCDTEINSIQYVEPLDRNVTIMTDNSGSMKNGPATDDGTRIDNAKKVATLEADLLQDGDRIRVVGFGGIDSPAGCGLPGGSGNCPYNGVEFLARTDVLSPNVALTIQAAKLAIDSMDWREEWTPLGAALEDARDGSLALPANTNPHHVIFLSDGEETALPLVADVLPAIDASGIVVHTVGLGPEAEGASTLLAEIAATTGGTYRHVPTVPGGRAASRSGIASMQSQRNAQVAELNLQALADAAGLPGDVSAMEKSMQALALPGHLGLADVYDQFDTNSKSGARISHFNYLNVPGSTQGNPEWRESIVQVSDDVTELRFVVAGKQFDSDVTDSCEGYHRRVEVRPANSPEPPTRGYIPISPILKPVPSNWDVRNSAYDDVLIVTLPAPGEWKIRVRYYFLLCRTAPDGKVITDTEAIAAKQASAPEALESDFMINASVQSDYYLDGYILADGNSVKAGETVHLGALLFKRTGLISGAIVAALVERPGGSESDIFLLFDDGMHNDGEAGDGHYGTSYHNTQFGGGYNVRIVTLFENPSKEGELALREWNGAFAVLGPNRPGGGGDGDDDGLPNNWENEYDCLNPRENDSKADPDKDGLSNREEFTYGTNPCRADTDGGGENDGSEIRGQRNPRNNPDDDKVVSIGRFNVGIYNELLIVGWRKPLSYTDMIVYVSTEEGELGRPTSMGTKPPYRLGGLKNDQTYWLTLQGISDDAVGTLSDQLPFTPKADPDMPSGVISINNGEEIANSTNVTLFVSATDTPFDGVAESSSGHTISPLAKQLNIVSAGVQMRFSNDRNGIDDAPWEPLAEKKDWTMDCESGTECRVYAQFKDAAENESLVIEDTIQYVENPLMQLWIPLVVK